MEDPPIVDTPIVDTPIKTQGEPATKKSPKGLSRHVSLTLSESSISLTAPLPWLKAPPGAPKKKKQRGIPWGIILSIISGIVSAYNTVVVKPFRKEWPLSSAMVGFNSYFAVMIFVFPTLLESGEEWFGPTFHPGIWIIRLALVLRGIFSGLSVWMRYESLYYINAGNFSVISLTSPAFVFVFAHFILKEPFGRFHMCILVLSLVGVFFATDIIKKLTDKNDSPPANSTTPMPNGKDNVDMKHFLYGNGFALLSTIVLSMNYILVRILKDVHSSVIQFCFNLVAALEMCAFLLLDFEFAINGYGPYIALSLTLSSLYNQLFMIKANQLEKAGIVAVVRSCAQTICAFGLEIGFLGKTPTGFTIFGAILVLIAVFLIGLRKYVLDQPRNSPLRKKYAWLTK